MLCAKYKLAHKKARVRTEVAFPQSLQLLQALIEKIKRINTFIFYFLNIESYYLFFNVKEE